MPHINQKQFAHLISAAEKLFEFLSKKLSSIEVEAQGLLEKVEKVIQAAETYVVIPQGEKKRCPHPLQIEVLEVPAQ